MTSARFFPAFIVAAGLVSWLLIAPRGAAGGIQAGASAGLQVTVREAGKGALLPCRLTLLTEDGELAPVQARREPWIAQRPGVVYTGSGRADISLPPGAYNLYVTRGLEYGLVNRRVTLGAAPVRLELELKREVDTRGYVSADPHIHTLTYSGHGDSTIEERMATIAGEGIELAIATDHNHHTDYRPVQQSTGTTQFFTSAIGNEVTTPVGHINAFPIRPGSAVPDWKSEDWKVLLAGARAVPGVQVVMLNHPGNDHRNFIPTDPRRFHPASGESHEGREWSFDGIEVVNSAALQSDMMKSYRDWFALLNQGRRITGMGSSDSHEVNRFILGQGRTYIAAPESAPGSVDVEAACRSILGGRALVSMGLLTEAWVDGIAVGGSTERQGREMEVRLRVQAPSWIEADRIELYQNGEIILDRPISSAPGKVVKLDQTFRLPRPRHDAWLVAIATGPGIRGAWWPTPRPYQPDRAAWTPRVIGSTNPIRIDGDGDNALSSPHDYAARLVTAHHADPRQLMRELAKYDTAAAVQAASILRRRGLNPAAGPIAQAADAAEPHVRHGFVAYNRLMPK